MITGGVLFALCVAALLWARDQRPSNQASPPATERNEGMPFEHQSINVTGMPAIDWKFDGDDGTAELAGARAQALAFNDQRAGLKIIDADGVVLADITVRKLDTDENITVSVVHVGSALLWSHARWVEAKRAEQSATEAQP